MQQVTKTIKIVDREVVLNKNTQFINVETDVNAEKIVFLIPQFYADHDLSQYDLVLYVNGVSEDVIAITGYNIVDNVITWEFIPSNVMTSKMGWLNIQLSAIKISQDGTLESRWQSKLLKNAFFINETIGLVTDNSLTPTPTYLEQYRSEIIEYMNRAEQAAASIDLTEYAKTSYVDDKDTEIKTLLGDKIDKTQIKNNTTETVEGNVLDATQGKVLNEKIGDITALTTTDKSNTVAAINELDDEINVLFVERGYGNAFKIEDADNAKLNGKYVVSSGIHTPSAGTWILDVIAETSNCLTQTAKQLWPDNCGSLYIRSFFNGVWNDWEQIATTSKTDILCTALPGYNVQGQTCYLENNNFQLNVKVCNTGATPLPTGNVAVCTMPFTCKGIVIGSAMASPDESNWNLKAVTYLEGNTVRVICIDSNIKYLHITLQGGVA